MPKRDVDLKSYQVAPIVMNRLNLDQGIVTKYHQLHRGENSYLANLKLLQYDMLYGDNYIFGGANPYKKANCRDAAGSRDRHLTREHVCQSDVLAG